MNNRRLSVLIASYSTILNCVACSSNERSIRDSTDDPTIQRKVAFCFAPDTPQWYVDQVAANPPFGSSVMIEGIGPEYTFSDIDRWSGGQGNPRALTWSLVPDGLAVDGGTSDLFNRMDALFATQGGRATWIARIQNCFDRWAELTGTSYTRITFGGNDWDDGASFGTGGGSTRGDIRIAMIPYDGQSGVLAYNYFPSHGDMVLDRDENWGSSNNMHRFLRNVIQHEHGHGLGIQHVCPTNATKIMEPFISTSYDGIRHDDVRAGQRAYGDAYENNDVAGSATDLGEVLPGVLMNNVCTAPAPLTGTNDAHTTKCSIDGNGDVDFFRFSVSVPALASVTLTPAGVNYASYPQSTCGSTTPNMNSLALADLNVQILGPDGVTVLATAANQPSGSGETLTNVPLTGSPATYYVRVYEGDSPTQSQAYRLTLSVTATAPSPCLTCTGDVNADNTVNGRDVQFFVSCALLNFGPACPCANLDGDSDVDSTDVSLFVNRLLTATGLCQ